jgi:MFS superfamily sulfate permease-like transporter
MTPSLRYTLLGILSFVPLLSLGAVVIFLSRHPGIRDALNTAGDISPSLYAVTVPVWGLSGVIAGLVVGLILYVYFVARVIRAPAVATAEKIAWVVALSLAGPIAIPIAWWTMRRFGAA